MTEPLSEAELIEAVLDKALNEKLSAAFPRTGRKAR